MPIAPTRIYHANVNCSDLDRSLAFYTELVGLAPVTRTAPAAPQPGGAFGLEQVQWDAWILGGDDGNAGPVLDLLEWKVPAPQGKPAGDPTATGFNRLGITTPDIDGLHKRLVDAAVDVWSAPSPVAFEHASDRRMFVCTDPDGTQLELVEGPSARMSHVVVNCADVRASRRYYNDVIGLQVDGEVRPGRQSGMTFRLPTDIDVSAVRMRDPGSGFVIELLEWLTPRSTATLARKANDLGIFRMAWHTTDIDRDYQALLDAGVTCYSPPAGLEMGPGIPPLRALFWNDPDGACLELIEPS